MRIGNVFAIGILIGNLVADALFGNGSQYLGLQAF